MNEKPMRHTIFKAPLKKPVRKQYYALSYLFDEYPLYTLHQSDYDAYRTARHSRPLYRINVKVKRAA